MIKCKVCNSRIKLKNWKFDKYSIPVCSEECFVKFINKIRHRGYIVKPMVASKLNFKSELERIAYRNIKKYFEVMYEPFSFTMGRTVYVPDFYLPKFNVFIEVKGDNITRLSKIIKANDNHIKLFVLSKTQMELFGWVGEL